MSDANKNSSCKHVLMITYLVSGGKRTQGSPGQNQGEVKRKGTYCRWVPGTEKASGREELSWASTSLVLSLWAITEATCFTTDQPEFSVLALSAVGFQNRTLLWSALSSPCTKAYTEDMVENKAVAL